MCIMPKVKSSLGSKINAIVTEFPAEFTKTPIPQLFCNICNCVVKCDKRFHIDCHRKSRKHQKGVQALAVSAPATQSFLKTTSKDFTESVTRAFLSADIPLYKLQNKELQELFTSIGKQLPSESSCRKKAIEIGMREHARVKELMSEKKVFLVVDESDISGKKYLNVLVGALDEPETTFLIDCRPLVQSPTNQTVCQAIDDYTISECCENRLLFPFI